MTSGAPGDGGATPEGAGLSSSQTLELEALRRDLDLKVAGIGLAGAVLGGLITGAFGFIATDMQLHANGKQTREQIASAEHVQSQQASAASRQSSEEFRRVQRVKSYDDFFSTDGRYVTVAQRTIGTVTNLVLVNYITHTLPRNSAVLRRELLELDNAELTDEAHSIGITAYGTPAVRSALSDYIDANLRFDGAVESIVHDLIVRDRQSYITDRRIFYTFVTGANPPQLVTKDALIQAIQKEEGTNSR